MPSNGQILAGLAEIANAWRPLAIFWHAYFAVLAVILITGARPKKRILGAALALPFFSVSVIAWLAFNPFNGIIYALLGLILVFVSLRLPRENVAVAPLWAAVPGIALAAFGWLYPHFLENASPWKCLYAAPTGLIPCPTLSIVVGFTLVLRGLDSRAFSLVLGVVALFYGVTGVVQLGVAIDWVLLFGAAAVIVNSFFVRYYGRRKANPPSSGSMTAWGAGPRIAAISLPYLAFAVIFHLEYPGMTLMTREPHIVFPVAGAVLIAVGVAMWIFGARIIDKAFAKGELLTRGVYAIVRHPMYSGLIVFFAPGIALLFRSWSLLTAPAFAYVVTKVLIKQEENYLEEKFGGAYAAYRARTNSLIPFPRISR